MFYAVRHDMASRMGGVRGAALVGPPYARVTPVSGGASGASEHRPDVPRQPRLGRGRRVRQRARADLTPRIDKLAAEGIRLNNFNVEFSCTVSRAALMTGRYAIRSGATQPGGITLWEVTIAEALKSVGYATALFGKWHLGGDRPEGRREPTHQGFDEFYGIPRTSNEAQTTIAQGQTTPGHVVHLGGRRPASRRATSSRSTWTRAGTIDRESADREHRVHGEERAARASRSSSTTR